MSNPVKFGKVFLDGNPYSSYNSEGIIIPKGNHVLSFGSSANNSENKENSLRLTGISDELISCSQSVQGIELVYQSLARCLITLNKLPALVIVDGKIASLKILKENNSFIIFAPRVNILLVSESDNMINIHIFIHSLSNSLN